MDDSKHSFLRFEDPIPPKKFEEMVRKNLGETKELKEDCLNQLRLLINEHKLPCATTGDFLLRFLRFKKFDTKKSFEALRNYIREMADLHKHVLKLRPEILETCFDQNVFGILPHRDAEGRFLCFFRPGIWNPNMFSFDELVTACLFMVTFTCEKESAQVAGIVSICGTAVPLSYIFYLMRGVNRIFKVLINCTPARYKAWHLIIDSSVIEFILAVISPFLPKKLAQRLVFHKEPGEKLFKDVPRNILPDEFGGTMGPMNADHLKGEVMAYFHKLRDEHHVCTLCTNT